MTVHPGKLGVGGRCPRLCRAVAPIVQASSVLEDMRPEDWPNARKRGSFNHLRAHPELPKGNPEHVRTTRANATIDKTNASSTKRQAAREDDAMRTRTRPKDDDIETNVGCARGATVVPNGQSSPDSLCAGPIRCIWVSCAPPSIERRLEADEYSTKYNKYAPRKVETCGKAGAEHEYAKHVFSQHQGGVGQNGIRNH